MMIEKAIRRCRCKYESCSRKTRVMEAGDKRVNISTSNNLQNGFAHPSCALKMLNDKIRYLQEIKNDFLQHETEIVEDEL